MTAALLPQKLDTLYGLRLHARHYGVHGSLDERSGYRALLARLGNPHLQIPPAIHVAGTNGKGSVVAFLKAMYEAEGYKVHAYTSPHLVRFNERIVLAGTEIDNKTLETLIDEVMTQGDGLPLTFFEIVTAMAFLSFSRVPAHLSLIETGMGGRIDCTNVIEKPLATIITRISRDHCQYLGQTIQEIATEKAGIMKRGAPCIIGYQGELEDAAASHDSPMPLFDSIAGRNDTPLHRSGIEWGVSIPESDPSHFIFRYGSLQNRYFVPKLVGAHQVANAGAALACTHVIDSLPIHDESRAAGLMRVRWPGRLQRLEDGPLKGLIPAGWELWLDGGHNDSAGQVLARQARQWHDDDARPLHLVAGMKRDKDAGLFLTPLLPHLASLTLIPVPGFESESHDPATLAAMTRSLAPALPVTTAPRPDAALAGMRNDHDAVPASRVLITGSLYLAGAVLGLEGNIP